MSTIAQRIADDKAARAFASDLISKFKISNQDQEINFEQAVWTHHRLRAAVINVGGTEFTIDLLNLVVSGDITVAKYVLDLMTPDDMTQPYHWLSQERLDAIRAEINAYLGL